MTSAIAITTVNTHHNSNQRVPFCGKTVQSTLFSHPTFLFIYLFIIVFFLIVICLLAKNEDYVEAWRHFKAGKQLFTHRVFPFCLFF